MDYQSPIEMSERAICSEEVPKQKDSNDSYREMTADEMAQISLFKGQSDLYSPFDPMFSSLRLSEVKGHSKKISSRVQNSCTLDYDSNYLVIET